MTIEWKTLVHGDYTEKDTWVGKHIQLLVFHMSAYINPENKFAWEVRILGSPIGYGTCSDEDQAKECCKKFVRAFAKNIEKALD